MEEVDKVLSQQNQVCSTHKRARICFASLSKSEDGKSPFLCSVCSVSKQYETNSFVSIEDILFTDLAHPIKNWPPQIDMGSLKFLKNKQSDILKEELEKGIIRFYEELRKGIDQILLDSQKKQLLELEIIKIGSNGLIDFYNKCFKREELLNIFSNQQRYDKDLYQNLINTMSETSKNHLEELQKVIGERKKNEIDFRKFQNKQLITIADKILSTFNENSPILLTGKDEDYSFLEEYEFFEFSPISEYREKIQKKNNLIEEITQHHLKNSERRLLINDSEQLEVKYQEDSIKIFNKKQRKCQVEPYFYNDIFEKIFFQVRFDNLNSLKNVKFVVFPRNEIKEYEFTGLFEKICNHFEQKQAKEIIFKIVICVTEDYILLTADGFKQKQVINFNLENEDQFSYKLQLNEECQGFEISEFKETDLRM